MPVKRVTDTNETPESAQDAADTIRRALIDHQGSARWLRAQRKRGAKRRVPALATKISFDPGADEDVDSLAAEAAAAIMDVISVDADGEQWDGEVSLLGDETRFGKPKVIASIDVLVEGEIVASPAVAKARAEADTMTAQAKTIDGLGVALVKLANAKASDAETVSKLGQVVSEMARTNAEWNYKAEAEKQETEREEIRERASTTRSRQRWDVFETLLEEYKDVATIWSQWFTQARKEGDGLVPGKPPTDEEMGKIFRDGRFEDPVVVVEDGKPQTYNLRGVIEEMRVEKDRKIRITLAKRLTAVLNTLPKTVQANLKLVMVEELGVDRALEIAVWLAIPIAV